MRGTWWIFDATRRRRWAAWLSLALLISLVGGAVLASVTAARATQRAFPDFVKRYGATAGIFEVGASPSSYTHLQGVDSYVVYPAYANGSGTAGSAFIPDQDFSLLSLPTSGKEPDFRLLSGHLPKGDDQVIAGFSLEQEADLHLGSTITVTVGALAQQREFDNPSNQSSVQPIGPTFRFHVVGFYTSILDFPSASPSYTAMTSRAFQRTEGPKLAGGYLVVMRLHGGASDITRFTYQVQHVPTRGFVYPYPLSLVANVVNGSLHPLVVGWWLFALIVCLVGLVLVAQALSRQSIVERLAYPTLSAVGVSPTQLFWLGMLRAAVIGVVGAAGAVGLAVLASPLTLVGEARAAEPTTGFITDPLVLSIGSVGIVLGVLALAALPSWRASRVRSVLGAQDSGFRRPNAVASFAARAGAPPAMLIGVRHALERGRGRGSVPVATAILGTVVAVVALVGSVVFGASLSNLLATPRLWGQAWQLDVGGFTGPADVAAIHQLLKSPEVTAADYGVKLEVEANGVPVNVVAYLVAKGRPVFATIDGHDPTGVGQIALGTTTASQAHASIGSMLRVSIIGPTGKQSSGDARLVGIIASPPTLSGGAVGDGAVMMLPTIYDIVCGSGSAAAGCRSALAQTIDSPQFANWGAAVAFRNSPAGIAALHAGQRRYAAELTVITKPTALLNFGGGINFPLLLGWTMALFGAATLVHLLVVSVSRRRREHALLKVLGFVRLQVRAAVCWQALTIAVIGIVAGVPLGIAAGRGAWRAFSVAQGVIDQSVVPFAQLALIGGAVLAVGLLFSLAPASAATRLRPASALRDE